METLLLHDLMLKVVSMETLLSHDLILKVVSMETMFHGVDFMFIFHETVTDSTSTEPVAELAILCTLEYQVIILYITLSFAMLFYLPVSAQGYEFD